jgi:hypothetical protein
MTGFEKKIYVRNVLKSGKIDVDRRWHEVKCSTQEREGVCRGRQVSKVVAGDDIRNGWRLMRSN